MSEEFQAVYEHGILRLDQPLALPERARVSGVLIQVEGDAPVLAGDAFVREPLSDDEFDRLLDELALDAPILPPDFSRADIYLDHD